MHLSPKLYHIVQKIAHGNYEDKLESLFKLLDAKKEDIIIELGCGVGGFSNYVLKRGFQYYGIDMDQERVEIAKQKEPKATFITSDLTKFDFLSIPNSKKFFCMEVLHHLDDEQCKKVINNVTQIHNNVKFVAIEPIRPELQYTNPIGTFVADHDDGNYIRKLEEWKILFEPWLKEIIILKNYRWPLANAAFLLAPKEKYNS